MILIRDSKLDSSHDVRGVKNFFPKFLTASMPTTSDVEDALRRLLNAINSLPASCVAGRRDGPLAEYLSPTVTLSADNEPTTVFPTHEEGPYYAFNRHWERVFQKHPSDPSAKLHSLVSRGKHGIILAHAWAAHYATVVPATDLPMIKLRVEQLLQSISDV